MGSLVLLLAPYAALLFSARQPPMGTLASITGGHRHGPLIAAAAASEGGEGAEPKAGRLLFLVDDQPGMRSAVERYLSQRGFRCEAFESASEALEAMTHTTPDALVTDVLRA